jgi:hypothetical protein
LFEEAIDDDDEAEATLLLPLTRDDGYFAELRLIVFVVVVAVAVL